MKPTLAVEEGKPLVVLTGPSQSSGNEEKKGRSIKKGVVLVVVSMVIVAICVALSVYFGMKITMDTYKDAWKTYKMADGQTVDEKITVTDDMFNNLASSQMEVIYDYRYDLKVQRFVDRDTGRFSQCYATYINDSRDADPKFVADHMSEQEVNVTTEKSKVVKETWTVSDSTVPGYMTSKEMQEMCKDTHVYWMQKTRGDGVAKRALKLEPGYDRVICTDYPYHGYETVCYYYYDTYYITVYS